MIAHTIAQLPEVLHIMLYGDSTEPSTPELTLILSALHHLAQDEEFIIVDPESGTGVEPWIYGLGGMALAQWSGKEHPDLMGYGDLQLINSSQGNGLAISLGGSDLQSATTIWVLPARLIAYMAGQDD